MCLKLNSCNSQHHTRRPLHGGLPPQPPPRLTLIEDSNGGLPPQPRPPR